MCCGSLNFPTPPGFATSGAPFEVITSFAANSEVGSGLIASTHLQRAIHALAVKVDRLLSSGSPLIRPSTVHPHCCPLPRNPKIPLWPPGFTPGSHVPTLRFLTTSAVYSNNALAGLLHPATGLEVRKISGVLPAKPLKARRVVTLPPAFEPFEDSVVDSRSTSPWPMPS